MSDLDKRLAARQRLTPKTGWNLVGVDDYEDPGEELYLVGHYETRQEAEAALGDARAGKPDEKFYIYEPEGN